MAIRERQLGFWLLSCLIVLHALAVLIIYTSSCLQLRSNSSRALLTLSFKDVLSLETFLWEISLLLTGIFAVYQFVATYVCDQCLLVALEVSFVVMPLFISFIHPLVIAWNVLPLRDAAVRVFPALAAIVPEYAFVPPPPSTHFHFDDHPPTNAFIEGKLEKPKILGADEAVREATPSKRAAKDDGVSRNRVMSY